MFSIVPILIAASVLVFVFVLFLAFIGRDKSSKPEKKKKVRQKDRNIIIKIANRKLSQNPKDVEALLALAELYYKEEDYERAGRHYNTLINLCASHPELDEFEITMKHSLALLKQKNYDGAYKGLVIAKSMNSNNFEINYNLGYLEFLRKNYEKASSLLNEAKKAQPDHVQTTRFLGLSLFKDRHFSEAVNALKRAIEYEPNDKDSIFALGQCYYEMGSNENALKIFTQLRTDPKHGPSASLFAGTINMNAHAYPKAIMDYEIGLRHEGKNIATEMELKYRLALAYLKQQEIDRALNLLRDVLRTNPDYKDVTQLVKKYRELSKNKSLQTYLISPTSEFVTLCRKIASNYFKKSRTKLVDISIVKNEYIDILAEVSTSKWEDLVLFRFIRTTGSVGELIVRELYARCKDVRAGRGFCLTAGAYSEGAKQFVEARLVDLIEKDDLVKLFDQLSLSTTGKKQRATV